jgi:hypothetical protein
MPKASAGAGAAVRRCLAHPGQPLPCGYRTKACVGPEYLDDSARAVLAKLNPSTLVKLIESLVAALLNGNLNTHGAPRRVYADY